MNMGFRRFGKYIQKVIFTYFNEGMNTHYAKSLRMNESMVNSINIDQNYYFNYWRNHRHIRVGLLID